MSTTVGRYLIRRLQEAGLRDVFGIPGDYIIGFFDLLVKSPLRVIGTCTEAGAGFAADAYARVNGLGAVCVTYCVGGFPALNAVAGAYAEKSPLFVISGAPGLRERLRSPLLHHRVKDFNTQFLIFEKVTAAAAVIEDPQAAPRVVDGLLAACLRTKRPVYLELPRDVVDAPCPAPGPFRPPRIESDRAALAECLAEAVAMLRRARRPVIIGGVEIHRFGLQRNLLRLVERSGRPIATTLLDKSVISELHPQHLGIYEGAMGRDAVRRIVEGSDAVLILGAFMTDVNLGLFTAHLDVGRTIYATSERVTIRRHHYEGVALRDFIEGLARSPLGRRRAAARRPRRRPAPAFRPDPGRPITVRRFFQRMNGYLEDNSIVIADIGDCLFGAADLTIHRRTEFLSPAYYASMGFAVPASLGAQVRRRGLRPIVFVGDGAFQMSGQELSTIARLGLNPIVFVLNNKGYTMERFIHEGPYNDILDWAYHRYPDLLGAGLGLEARTEGELEEALAKARRNVSSFSLVNVHLDPRDLSDALRRVQRRLSEQAFRKGPSPEA